MRQITVRLQAQVIDVIGLLGAVMNDLCAVVKHQDRTIDCARSDLVVVRLDHRAGLHAWVAKEPVEALDLRSPLKGARRRRIRPRPQPLRDLILTSVEAEVWVALGGQDGEVGILD
jgi:hypothetical protein